MHIDPYEDRDEYESYLDEIQSRFGSYEQYHDQAYSLYGPDIDAWDSDFHQLLVDAAASDWSHDFHGEFHDLLEYLEYDDADDSRGYFRGAE